MSVTAVELKDFGGEVYFPRIEVPPPTKLEFSSLDLNTQQQLSDIIERDIFIFNKYVFYTVHLVDGKEE